MFFTYCPRYLCTSICLLLSCSFTFRVLALHRGNRSTSSHWAHLLRSCCPNSGSVQIFHVDVFVCWKAPRCFVAPALMIFADQVSRSTKARKVVYLVWKLRLRGSNTQLLIMDYVPDSGDLNSGVKRRSWPRYFVTSDTKRSVVDENDVSLSTDPTTGALLILPHFICPPLFPGSFAHVFMMGWKCWRCQTLAGRIYFLLLSWVTHSDITAES